MPGQLQPAAVKFTKGSLIIVEGKPSANRFYIIKNGQVQITRELDSIIKDTNKAGPGEMFGVVSAMASRSYIESAVALTDVVLLAVDRSLISNTIPVAVNIIRQFSQRLRKMNETYSRRLLKSAASEDPSHLFQIGKYYEKLNKYNQALYAYQQYLVYCPAANDISAVKEKVKRMQSHASVVKPAYPPNTMIQAYPKDCLLFAEGESGQNLYIIQNGAVKITKIADNQEVILAVLKKGDIFGEMSMLEDKPRAATAEIYEDTTLMAVNRSNFTNLINEQPEMVIRLTTLMAERIWLRYRQLINTSITNSLGRLYDALLFQLEINRVDLTSYDSYHCNFGFKELVSIAGIPDEKVKELYDKVSTSNKIAVEDEKVRINCIIDTVKDAEYYRHARKVETDN
ncbi:MAG: cyclic nucleotide-binding domain-containing protein [Treponema sp.]|jgi:CRP-like cAMP-binding protein|nr:cyclic nucleotide-binding domain-containing protein [Treponema sp.]